MRIRYYGIPVPVAGGAGMIVRWCDDDKPKGKPTDLVPRHDLVDQAPGLDWKPNSRELSQLSIALCAHVLKDDRRAIKVYQRFKLRKLAELRAGEPWSLMADDILAEIVDLETVEKETRRDVAAVARERGPVEHEGGTGPGGAPIKWDTDEHGQRKTPRGSDDE
jgi:hypothetical protein